MGGATFSFSLPLGNYNNQPQVKKLGVRVEGERHMKLDTHHAGWTIVFIRRSFALFKFNIMVLRSECLIL
jgi:hypothetical protein